MPNQYYYYYYTLLYHQWVHGLLFLLSAQKMIRLFILVRSMAHRLWDLDYHGLSMRNSLLIYEFSWHGILWALTISFGVSRLHHWLHLHLFVLSDASTGKSGNLRLISASVGGVSIFWFFDCRSFRFAMNVEWTLNERIGQQYLFSIGLHEMSLSGKTSFCNWSKHPKL